jgi:hypothetical protein
LSPHFDGLSPILGKIIPLDIQKSIIKDIGNGDNGDIGDKLDHNTMKE